MTARRVERTLSGNRVEEGAGVWLRRSFAWQERERLDPFLLFDDFGSSDPKEYLPGFPWHPHRGIETVTLMDSGRVEHGDSIGNAGVIGPGDVQWMTAGSGIVHQEMPQEDPVRLRGFQLWVNLPRSHKMTGPRYRGLTAAELPQVNLPGGVQVTVISGECHGTRGAVTDIVVPTFYLDVRLPAGTTFTQPVDAQWHAFAYPVTGTVRCGDTELAEGNLGILTDGDSITVKAPAGEARVLLAAGQPLRELIAWRGPIVMNTEEELNTAFREYQAGTFIRK
jgi:quercetin 2,3-dioxygenase